MSMEFSNKFFCYQVTEYETNMKPVSTKIYPVANNRNMEVKFCGLEKTFIGYLLFLNRLTQMC